MSKWHTAHQDERIAELEAKLAEAERISARKTEAVAEKLAQMNALQAKYEALETVRRDVLEIYAGMEGFEPQTAPEAYCLRIIDQMAKAALVHEEV